MLPSAPTGQASMHWPQNSQSSVSSNAGLTLVSKPLPIRFIAPTPWWSMQTRTHLPQSMQRLGLRSTSGAAVLSGSCLRLALNRLSDEPYLNARSCNSHSPALSHIGQSSGWCTSSSSSTVLRALCSFGVSVLTSMPGCAGVEQAASSLGLPSTSTTQSLQPP